jgi:hypothetical protein
MGNARVSWLLTDHPEANFGIKNGAMGNARVSWLLTDHPEANFGIKNGGTRCAAD